jgi:phosphate transport system substrate-binding protein
MSERLTITLLVLALAVSSACGRVPTDTGTGGGDAAGKTGGANEIFVSGSSTVEPISASNADKFSVDNGDVAIRVEGPGTGDGFEIFCSGESDISDASRPIKKEEVEKCSQAGIEFIELHVAIDGIAVVTSPDNDLVECLSFADLYALLGPESIGFERWSEANKIGNELKGEGFGEVHTPYPKVDLEVTGPGEESGTFDSFHEIVIEKVAEAREQDDTLPRPDYQASPHDNVIIDGISGSDTSLGWVGFAFVEQNRDTIKPLPVDGGEGCVEPTAESISNGEFPIARDLYIYVNKAKAEQKPALDRFVDFYLSDEGMETVGEVGYVNLGDEALDATRQVWETRRVGSVDGGE